MMSLKHQKIMRNFKIIFTSVIAGIFFTFQIPAQITNAFATEIENFELQTNTIIVKAFNPIGTVSVGNASISVHVKESSDITHAQKMYGVAVGFSGVAEEIPKFFFVVDYDELDSFSNAIDFVGKVNSDVTSLPAFEASYATKSGLRVIAHSDRRNGGITNFIQFGNWPRISLTSIQLAQLRTFIVQAKTSLDALK
jgi:hypothetical protein